MDKMDKLAIGTVIRFIKPCDGARVTGEICTVIENDLQGQWCTYIVRSDNGIETKHGKNLWNFNFPFVEIYTIPKSLSRFKLIAFGD